MSDDGAWSIVVIALLGNPFSPAYARARRGGAKARALSFCAMNVAIYGPNGALWALRERSLGDADREARGVSIGRSSMRWEGDALIVEIDERTSPLGRRLRGTVTFHPSSSGGAGICLDDDGRHTWWPIAPAGRLEVALEEPAVRFTGHGYHDANAGDVALESSFSRWTWSRARVDDHRSVITYDVTERSGAERSLGLSFDARRPGPLAVPGLAAAPLSKTGWRLDREARTERAFAPRVVRELEDTPFYSRALVATRHDGKPVVAMHETLSVDRFAQRWVQFLLGFRMGRG